MHTIAVGWFDLWGRCFGTMISGFALTYVLASQHLTDSLTLQNHFNQGILRYWFFYTSLRPVPVGARSWIRGFRRHILAAARLVDQHLFKMSTREIVNIFSVLYLSGSRDFAVSVSFDSIVAHETATSLASSLERASSRSCKHWSARQSQVTWGNGGMWFLPVHWWAHS